MTIFRKSILILGIAAFSLISIQIIMMMLFMNSLYYETNSKALIKTASSLCSVFTEEKLLEFYENEIVDSSIFPVNGQYRITLIDKDGEVLWDSHVKQSMVNHLDRKEIQSALEGNEGTAFRNSTSAGNKTLYATLPVKNSYGVIEGIFRLSVDVPDFWHRIAPAALPFLLISLVLLFAVLVGIFRISRFLSRSLERLVNLTVGTDAFPYTGKGMEEIKELYTLEKAFKNMSSGLDLALKETRIESRRLEAVLNSMSEAVIALDNNLLILIVNPCARALFNLGDRNINNVSLLEVTRSNQLEWAARKVLETGKPVDTELNFFHKGAELRFHVSINIFPHNEKEMDKVEGVVIVMEDRTRISRLEQVRKDFVANVSHELRTPIQLIKGFSETVLDSFLDTNQSEGSEKKEQLKHFIEIIQKNSGIMENLINDLLSLASLEDDSTVRPLKNELEIVSLFNEAVSSVETKAEKKQIKINIECQQDLKAKLYGSYIIQVLINLLDNAIKYSPDGSSVFARAFMNENELVFEVEDQGIGIPAEHHERIFERFYRVDKSRSREEGGTGLGLSIVRHITLLHNGKVEIESHAGEGSLFRLRMPA